MPGKMSAKLSARGGMSASLSVGGGGGGGQPGPPGFSPIANVTKSGDTATITITDKNGTTTATVKDGTDGADGTTPVKDVDYFDGSDGITPTTTVTTITGGHNVAFSYGSGDSRNTDFDVMDGQDGHTPVKGTDYWTAQDRAEIVQDVVDEVGIKTETVTGSTVSITGIANTRYMCGEVSTISITPPQSGIIDVIFTSGSSVAVLTVPSTVKWPSGFDPTSLETNTTYELNVMDGIYGAVMKWA